MALFRMGYIDIDLADFYAMITAIALLREMDRTIGCGDIGHGDNFFVRHLFPQPPELIS